MTKLSIAGYTARRVQYTEGLPHRLIKHKAPSNYHGLLYRISCQTRTGGHRPDSSDDSRADSARLRDVSSGRGADDEYPCSLPEFLLQEPGFLLGFSYMMYPAGQLSCMIDIILPTNYESILFTACFRAHARLGFMFPFPCIICIKERCLRI
ncbi:hypothetical protein BJY01DRAFT_120113 [Aspergillus pseudoustus]|uniref:Uncharacterized protein n=1 Tax=Aspergillus pseudoustus TaxID=1810923 RepID=A0ABR4KG04_9EURO